MCSFAAGTTSLTIGFTRTRKTKPMTLLKGDQLASSVARSLDLVLRRKRGEELFHEVIVGDADMIRKYHDVIKDEIADDRLTYPST